MTEATAQSEADKICVRCNTQEDVQISLGCGHSFCLICMSYIVIKCRANGNSETQVICTATDCNKACKLDESSLQAVKTTIQQTLLPRLNSIEEITQISSRNFDDSPDQQSLHMGDSQSHRRLYPAKQNPQSFQHSIEHITPSTRYLLSKADSPFEKAGYQQYCHQHPLEESSFVCLTCANTLLCVRCMMLQSHNGHNVKTLERSIEFLTEQMSVRKLQVNEKIGLLQMKQRRLHDKKELLVDRCNKAKMQIIENIGHVIAKAKKKESELLLACQNHFQVIENAISVDLQNIKKRLYNLQRFKHDFRKLHNAQDDRSLDFFTFFNKVKTELDQNLSESPLKYSNHSIDSSVSLQQRDLLDIIDSLSRLQVYIGSGNGVQISGVVSSCGLGLTSNIGLASSVNSVNNITVTNFTSKNTSTEKKRKQHLKTEESEYVHLKTEHVRSAGKLGIRCGSPGHTELPSYITKFLEKHSGTKQNLNDSQSKFSSSKFTNSKFSFNGMEIQGQEGAKRRGTIQKKRVERKTANPLQSLKNQKIIFQNKKTRNMK